MGSEREGRVRGVSEAGLLNPRPGDISGLRILCAGAELRIAGCLPDRLL